MIGNDSVVILRAKAWAPILDDEDGRALMLPLLLLGSDDDRPLFDAAPLPEAEKLLERGADVLMEAVPAIHGFWKRTFRNGRKKLDD